MKINQLYLGLLGLIALTFTACSDDDDYTRATISGNQVYFSQDLPTKQDVSVNSTTFVIPVNRQETTEAITVPLVVTGEGLSLFSVPTSVSFPAGSDKADLVLTYDPSTLTYGDYRPISIQIGDENYTTPYGISRYEFTIGVTDWDEWRPYNDDGTCDYTYTNYWSGVDAGLDFYVRDNLITTNLHQFRIDNWGAGNPLILNYDDKTGIVSVDDAYLTNNANYGAVRYCDANYYWEVIRNSPLEEPVYGSFDEENGIITIPICYYVSAGYFGYADEYVYIGGFDRADATCKVTYAGKLIAPDETPYVIAGVTLGDDVTSANVALVQGSLTEEALNAIIDGTYEPLQTIEKEGEVRFNAAELPDGTHTFVVVTFVDKKAMEYDAATFKYQAAAANWTSLGMGYYVEDALLDLYTSDGEPLAPLLYEVEIEASADKPGLYRMVDPYGAAFPYNEEGDWDASRKWNIEVDAQDPQGVFIELQECGLDWGNGMLKIQSLGSFYMDNGRDFETVKKAGVMGVLEDGVITFPEKGMILYLGEDGPYQGGKYGPPQIYLPGHAPAGANVKAVKARVKVNKDLTAKPYDKYLYSIAPKQVKTTTLRSRNLR